MALQRVADVLQFFQQSVSRVADGVASVDLPSIAARLSALFGVSPVSNTLPVLAELVYLLTPISRCRWTTRCA